MKKFVILFLACAFVIACQEKQEQRYFENSPEIETTKTIIKAYEKGDWETWMTHYADTAKIFHNNWAEPVSASELKDGFKETLASFSSYGFEGESFYEMVINAEGQKWVHFWGSWQGTLAANDQILSIPVHLAINFVDGKNVMEFGFWDTAPLVNAFAELAEAESAEAAVEE